VKLPEDPFLRFETTQFDGVVVMSRTCYVMVRGDETVVKGPLGSKVGRELELVKAEARRLLAGGGGVVTTKELAEAATHFEPTLFAMRRGGVLGEAFLREAAVIRNLC